MQYLKNVITYSTVIVLLSSILSAQNEYKSYITDPAAQPRQQVVDVINLKGELKISGPENFITGTVTMSFKPFTKTVDSLMINCSQLNVKKVMLEEKELQFKWSGDEIIVYPEGKFDKNKIYDIVIDYDAHPKEGLYFRGWQPYEKFKRKQIWAHGPGGWCPFINIKHDILTSEFIITFDKNYEVFSNGICYSQNENSDGTKTWHYKIDKPHVVYLICMAIGDYGVKKFTSNRGLPLEYLYYKDMPERFDLTYIHSKEMFDFIEDETGTKYPWPLYRNMPVGDYMYGGMETTTSTIYGDFMYIDPRAQWMRKYENVNVHELIHQWFGNYVSNINKDIWLTESFATYYAKKFEQSIYGEDYYQIERFNEFEKVSAAAKKNDYPIGSSKGGSDRWYPKGSLVLDMMRDVMGDALFKAAIQKYLADNANQVVASADLLRSIRESSGQSLEWFLDEWIARGGEPNYKVDYQEIEKDGKNYTYVTVEQIHKMNDLIGLFKMPVEIDVYYKNGKINNTKHLIEDKFTNLFIDNGDFGAVDFIVFDPNRKLVKYLTFDRTFDQLSAQAKKAKNMIDRFDALTELAKFPLDKKIDLFKKIYTLETSYLTKNEIIKQIAAEKEYFSSPAALDIITKAINSGEEMHIRAVCENILIIPTVLKNVYEKILADSCYKNIELALDNLCTSFPENTNKYLEVTSNLMGWRGNNIRIKWLEIAIAAGKAKYLKELIDYSSRNYEFETRINSINALKRLNICNEEITENLLYGVLFWNFKLSQAATEALKYFAEQRKYKIIINQTVRKSIWTIEEKQKFRSNLRS
ncbi:MAG: M1 family metallopeptidase [bacterium]